MYSEYIHARNTAWKVLIECGIRTLPLNLMEITKHYGIGVILYSKSSIVQAFQPEALSGDGFCGLLNGKPVIFLNDLIKTRGRRRFTMGHELGHILLGHPSNELHFRNSERDNYHDIGETACNIFSRDLLAPARILAALDLHTPEEIMQMCDISRQSAEIRAKRMEALYERNRFDTNAMERQLLAQFKGFIESV